jgi:Zn-dependent peptidase ImmA (M78 family)
MEQEANEFAVALLMPAADIRPYFIGRKIDLSTLAALKPEWRVSMAALLMRAHRLKFLSDNQHTYLWKQISARGYRLREPPELDFEPERPELLPQIVRVHFDALGYSREDLAKFLNVRASELQDLYSVDRGSTQARKFTVLR